MYSHSRWSLMAELREIGNETLHQLASMNGSSFLVALVEGHFLEENSTEKEIWKDYATPMLIWMVGILSVYT